MKLNFSILRAFRYKNYCLFFGGQGISLAGTWMQQMAMGWLVYRLTNSAFLLGVVGFSGQIATFFLAPFAGVLADRFNRQRILIITQALAMAQALILAFLVMSGSIMIWHIIALSVFLGFINAVDIPVRHAFVADLIEAKEDLGNAIALNSLMFNAARFIGPSIAGILVAAFNEGVCFLINGLSYIAVIIALVAIRVREARREKMPGPMLAHLSEGFAYAFRIKAIRATLLVLGILTLAGSPYVILMPIFAKEILKGGPNTMGFLMGATGVGALAGAVYLAGRKSMEGLGRVITRSTIIFGVSLIAFSLSRNLGLSLFITMFIGLGVIIQAVSSNTVLQLVVDDDKRGRVMSFFTMAFMGMMPFGSLLGGILAGRIGVPNTLAIGGAVCILVSLIFKKALAKNGTIYRPGAR